MSEFFKKKIWKEWIPEEFKYVTKEHDVVRKDLKSNEDTFCLLKKNGLEKKEKIQHNDVYQSGFKDGYKLGFSEGCKKSISNKKRKESILNMKE